MLLCRRLFRRDPFGGVGAGALGRGDAAAGGCAGTIAAREAEGRPGGLGLWDPGTPRPFDPSLLPHLRLPVLARVPCPRREWGMKRCSGGREGGWQVLKHFAKGGE